MSQEAEINSVQLSLRGPFFLEGLLKHNIHSKFFKTGAPNVSFSENICSEDDLRSRIFGTFVVNFLLACLS